MSLSLTNTALCRVETVKHVKGNKGFIELKKKERETFICTPNLTVLSQNDTGPQLGICHVEAQPPGLRCHHRGQLWGVTVERIMTLVLLGLLIILITPLFTL